MNSTADEILGEATSKLIGDAYQQVFEATSNNKGKSKEKQSWANMVAQEEEQAATIEESEEMKSDKIYSKDEVYTHVSGKLFDPERNGITFVSQTIRT